MACRFPPWHPDTGVPESIDGGSSTSSCGTMCPLGFEISCCVRRYETTPPQPLASCWVPPGCRDVARFAATFPTARCYCEYHGELGCRPASGQPRGLEALKARAGQVTVEVRSRTARPRHQLMCLEFPRILTSLTPPYLLIPTPLYSARGEISPGPDQVNSPLRWLRTFGRRPIRWLECLN